MEEEEGVWCVCECGGSRTHTQQREERRDAPPAGESRVVDELKKLTSHDKVSPRKRPIFM